MLIKCNQPNSQNSLSFIQISVNNDSGVSRVGAYALDDLKQQRQMPPLNVPLMKLFVSASDEKKSMGHSRQTPNTSQALDIIRFSSHQLLSVENQKDVEGQINEKILHPLFQSLFTKSRN